MCILKTPIIEEQKQDMPFAQKIKPIIDDIRAQAYTTVEAMRDKMRYQQPRAGSGNKL